MDGKLTKSHTQSPEDRKFSPQAIHLLRTMQNNTLLLSNMADNKASILMGATFLVFSVVVSRAVAGDLPWSLMILAAFAFLSSLLAVMAVMPSVGKAPPSQTPNMLFFGHFAVMDEELWATNVLDRLEQDESLFRAILHDIYQNGQVLQQRKYRFLAFAYRSFIIGLVATLTTYIAESMLVT